MAGNSEGPQAEASSSSLVDGSSSRTQPNTGAVNADGGSEERPGRSSYSHWDPNPGFAHVDGDIDGPGYNETKVDIVCVPCPGADPVETWMRDPLPDSIFPIDPDGPEPDCGAAPTAPGDAAATRRPIHHTWVQQGIRSSVSIARVLLYRHRELTDGLDLQTLAQDLMQQVWDVRYGEQRSRPLFFIGHSIGGLVIKLALRNASRDENYQPFWHNCHGVSFFGTPHRGSSYMSMPNLSESIQGLLNLQRPLPRSLASVLRLNSKQLQKLQDDFMDIADELRIWTFYEAIDSQLSGLSSSHRSGSRIGHDYGREVRFGAPLVSIKSVILGLRREQVLSLESDHARLASFGPENLQTMDTYLEELASAVVKARALSVRHVHHPLMLKDKVKVDLVGFYEDPDAEMESAIRLYFSQFRLAEFLDKGPEKCLEERLNTLARRAGDPETPPQPPGTSRSAPVASGSGLGLWSNVQKIFKSPEPESKEKPTESPGIMVTEPSSSPPSPPGLIGAQSMPVAVRPPAPAKSLGVPGPPPPGFLSRSSSKESNETATTTGSGVIGGDHSSVKSQGEREAVAETKAASTSPAGSSSQQQAHAADTAAAQVELLRRVPTLSDMAAGFSRPDKNKRKLTWIHLPFTNPAWVKEIFGKLSETHGNLSKLFSNENWISKQVSGRHSVSQPSFMKPTANFIYANAQSPHMSPQPAAGNGADASGRTSPGLVSPELVSLYLPYLHFDTYLNMIKRRHLIERRASHGRARPVPEDIADLHSLELRVIWEYLGAEPPLHFRRTLDQFGNPSLRDTFARDDDQMLYKLTKQEEDSRSMRGGAGARAGRGKKGWAASRRMVAAAAVSAVEQGREKGEADLAAAVGEAAGADAGVASEAAPKEAADDLDYDDDDGNASDVEIKDDDYKDGNVLMVDQLWLWAIDKTTLTTFFPKRESRRTEGILLQQADLRNSVYNELNGDLTGRTENALDLAAMIVLHAVTVLLDRASHPDLDVFRIFDEAIGMLTERMTSSLKRFRMQTFKRVRMHNSNDNNIDSSSSDDDDDDSDYSSDPEVNTSRNIKKRHRREIEKAERANRESTSALLELRDLEDELSTLLRLFDAQTAAIKTMAALYAGDAMRQHTTYGQTYLAEALARLDDYRGTTNEMLRRVDTTRKDYEKLLEMAQRQAQVDDVRWSRLQTELASSSNLSVMILTIFSVLFLPLTFLTGVWGMNTADWTTYGSPLDLRTIGAVSLPLSALLIVGSLAGAFSPRVQSVSRSAFRSARRLWRGAGRAVSRAWKAVVVGVLPRVLPRATRAARERRRRDRGRVEAGLRRAREMERSYDFWGDLRRRRGEKYVIPQVNRAVGGGDGGGLGAVGDGAYPSTLRARNTWRSRGSYPL